MSPTAAPPLTEGGSPRDDLSTGSAPRGKADIEARVPDFAELREAGSGDPRPAPAGKPATTGSLEKLLDVTCTVTAELGRRRLSIAEVLKLNGGAILELDRAVSEPVDVLVQGVLLARGEVVVVEDRFAIRIKEIVDAKKRDGAAGR